MVTLVVIAVGFRVISYFTWIEKNSPYSKFFIIYDDLIIYQIKIQKSLVIMSKRSSGFHHKKLIITNINILEDAY